MFFSLFKSSYWLLSILLYLWSEACPPEPPCSPVTSPNGKWARCSPWLLPGCGAVGSRTKTTLPLLFFLIFLLADHGRVSARTQSRTFADVPPLFCLPSVLPCVSLVTEPHLREPLASTPRSCLLLFTCLPKRLPSTQPSLLLTAFHFPAHHALFVARVSPFSGFVWLKVSRAKSNDSAVGFDWLKSRDNCVYTYRAEWLLSVFVFLSCLKMFRCAFYSLLTEHLQSLIINKIKRPQIKHRTDSFIFQTGSSVSSVRPINP